MCRIIEEMRNEERAEGRAEGRAETAIAFIKNFMQNTGASVEQAMATLGVPEDSRQEYRDMIGGNHSPVADV